MEDQIDYTATSGKFTKIVEKADELGRIVSDADPQKKTLDKILDSILLQLAVLDDLID